ncbi:MAG: TonB-dependent receptor [Sphingomonas sp. SCN 67-18]|uniref:TonB-dependent receptor n=1 Tax=uncultured Sphingomonas sp. TaxID=158754 RepID=UPI00086D2B0E|nr:TonB-dependent receptor [Sphingomonas sp. SCN 67-18]ODU20345.1 MAG: TonB-dependent receptor [Sphingomonas sp. SCN 67-18]
MSGIIFNPRTLLGLGVAFAAIATAPAIAQDTPDGAAADESGEILVIARKREERLVDVPIAISAFGTEEISKLQANDLSGVQGAVPNVNLVQGRGSTSSANIFIRGIGQPDALQTFDPAVGVYVDGVYLSRIQGALFSLADVERIEVLRGPQGTLYGKNTIGGAVNVVSRKPDLVDARVAGDVTYGSYDQWLANAYLSVPLVTDRLALSLAGVYDERDGTVTDPLTGRKYNDRNSRTVRGIVRAKPSDGVELILSGDYTRQRNGLTLGYGVAPLCQTLVNLAGFPLATQSAECPPSALPTITPNVAALPAQPYGPYAYKASTSFNDGEGQRLDHWGTSLTANIDLSDTLTLTSITAYRDLQADFFIDIDATQLEMGDVFVGVDQHQFSQELQLKYDGERMKGVFGLYYLNEQVNSHQEAYADDLFALTALKLPVTFTRFIDDQQRTRSYAAFGQLTYDFTDRLSLTAGLRYTREKKRYHRFTDTESTLPTLDGLAYEYPQNLPAPFTGDGDISFEAWTPSATLSYKPSRDTLLYASAARGFKSGGFNGRVNGVGDITLIVDGTPTIVPFFKPETVWTYETGAKGSFLGGRVRLSGDAFYSDYKNFQARVGGGNNTGLGGALPVLNAGKLRIWGVEADIAVKPTSALTITSSFGYLNADYREFNDGRRVPPAAFSCNPTGAKVVCKPAFAPPITFRLGADYAIPLGAAGSITLGGEGRFVDKQFLSVDNRPGLYEDGYWLANAYVQYDAAGGKYYLRGAVKNLTKTLYKTDGQEFSSIGNIQTVYYGDPRTFTVTAGFRF